MVEIVSMFQVFTIKSGHRFSVESFFGLLNKQDHLSPNYLHLATPLSYQCCLAMSKFNTFGMNPNSCLYVSPRYCNRQVFPDML